MLRTVMIACLPLVLAGCASNFGGGTPKAGFGYAANEAAPRYARTNRPARHSRSSRRSKSLNIPKRIARRTPPQMPETALPSSRAAADDRLVPSQYEDIRGASTGGGKLNTASITGALTGNGQATGGRVARLDARAARDLINAYRRKKGLAPLTLNARLTRAAMAHSRDLARYDRISHHGSDGSDPWDRVKRTGYRPRLAAENVGTGQANLQEVFKGWQDSPGHNANLLLKDATQMGIALVYDPKTEYRTFWTLVLGSPL